MKNVSQINIVDVVPFHTFSPLFQALYINFTQPSFFRLRITYVSRKLFHNILIKRDKLPFWQDLCPRPFSVRLST